MKFFIKIFLLFIFFSSCEELEPENNNTEFPPYQLLNSQGERLDHFFKIAIIRHFKDVVLGSEFGTSFPIVKKWRSKMKVFVGGEQNPMLLDELYAVASEINALTTDGFSIEIVDTEESANFYVYLGNAEGYIAKYPDQQSYINENRGLFSVSWTSKFEITSGHMFVNIDLPNSTEQRHVLREELTQALGFTNDVPYFWRSIFYKDRSSITTYDTRDMEIIRLLYHPKVVSGLNEETVEHLLRAILNLN